MDARSVTRATVHACGFFGIALLAYSAGYTRAFIVANGIEITSQNEIVSLGGIPTWTGILGFVGMGLAFLFLLGTVLRS